MKDRGQIRKDILAMPIGDILNEIKDSMDLANRCGDICATVSFANEINVLNEIIDGLVTVDEETDGLITEG